MAIKNYYDNPKVTDDIVFNLFTPDAENCFNANPVQFDNIKIFFISRNLSGSKTNENQIDIYDIKLQEEYYRLQQLACSVPTNINIANAQKAKDDWMNSTFRTDMYYSEATAVFNMGSYGSPLWRNDLPFVPNPIVVPISDPNIDLAFGLFQFVWKPNGTIREGDYYICYSYTPSYAKASLTKYLSFYVQSNIANDVANPAHITKPEKYQKLLQSYLPEMYSTSYTTEDISYNVLTKFNNSVAGGFTTIENYANQIIDIVDANATQEPLLNYVANLFAQKLRSTDVTLWRKQIKKAVPNMKMKGTLKGLEEALMDAGIRLIRFDQLWQTRSQYFYTETFVFIDSLNFLLTKVSLPINILFTIQKRSATGTYEDQPLTNINIITIDAESMLTWVGPALVPGDVIKISYQFKEYESDTAEILDLHIQRELPLADLRDDRYFEYPPKDWNTKLISKNDVLFDAIIGVQNPYVPFVNFGMIRTQFPYSENIYNMDEYNGSLRMSQSPSDIDKNFLEPCSSGISAYYSLDVEINQLSRFILQECQEIIAEYTPFHSILHTFNFSGSFTEFVVSPVETIEYFISYYQEDFMIAGMAQIVFNRLMLGGLQQNAVRRNELATLDSSVTSSSTAYNDVIRLFAPLINFSGLSINPNPNKTLLEILQPSAYYGNYYVSNVSGSYLSIAPYGINPVFEPLLQSEFNFRISNILLEATNFTVVDYYKYYLTDLDPSITAQFEILNIRTVWDVNNGYSPVAWKIRLGSNDYYITNINNGIIEIANDGTLTPNEIKNISYQILFPDDTIALSSVTGDYFTKKYGLVIIPSSLQVDTVRNILVGDVYFYQNGQQYKFYEFDAYNDQAFLIEGWTLGSLSVEGKVLNRVVNNGVGSLVYGGMKLLRNSAIPVFDDPATALVDNQNFKENYLITINEQTYAIIDPPSGVDPNYVYLSGKFVDFTTVGTAVDFTIDRYFKNDIVVFNTELRDVNRAGSDIFKTLITTGGTVGDTPTVTPFAFANDNKDSGSPKEILKTFESVSFKIEYKDGTTQSGEIK